MGEGILIMKKIAKKFLKYLDELKILTNYLMKIYNLNNINNAIQDLKNKKVLRPIVKLF